MPQFLKSGAACAGKITLYLIPYGLAVVLALAFLVGCIVLAVAYPLYPLPAFVVLIAIGYRYSGFYMSPGVLWAHLRQIGRQLIADLSDLTEYRRLAVSDPQMPSLSRLVWEGAQDELAPFMDDLRHYRTAIAAAAVWWLAIAAFGAWVFAGSVSWWAFASFQVSWLAGTTLVWNLIDRRPLPDGIERTLAATLASTLPTLGVLSSMVLGSPAIIPGALVGLLLIPASIAFYYRCEASELPQRLRMSL